jgi:hypothetical protein
MQLDGERPHGQGIYAVSIEDRDGSGNDPAAAQWLASLTGLPGIGVAPGPQKWRMFGSAHGFGRLLHLCDCTLR